MKKLLFAYRISASYAVMLPILFLLGIDGTLLFILFMPGLPIVWVALFHKCANCGNRIKDSYFSRADIKNMLKKGQCPKCGNHLDHVSETE